MSEEQEPHGPLIEVGRYGKLADARERALVVSARELPHWVERDGDEWVLLVELAARDEIERELALFEAEERVRPPGAAFVPMGKIETLSLYVVGWLMGSFFFLQNYVDPKWGERGTALSSEIVGNGEWWRVLTALTLHGDLRHVVGNIVIGLLFAAFLLPQLGTGLTWLSIVCSGAIGNAINAWGHRGESHGSIGSSTAVFGALGILVALDFVARFSSLHTRSRWQLVLPIGAGLGLLAFLGTGDAKDNVDYMAHLWGFVAGIGEGGALAVLGLGLKSGPVLQRLYAMVAVALIGVAWWLAWSSGQGALH